MTTAPYHWIKQIEETLEETKKIPLWGRVPPFPWKTCVEKLGEILSLSGLNITLKETKWRSVQELLENMGREPLYLTLEMTSLSGTFNWIMSFEDVSKFIAASLSWDPFYKSFSDKTLFEGYFTFLAIEAMQAIDSLQAFSPLSLRLSTKNALPQEGGLCRDFLIEMKGESLLGRLVCSKSFLHQLRQHYSASRPSLAASSLRHEIELDVHFDIGKTTLPLKRLKKIQVGDFIILDQCSYDPKKRKGKLNVMLENTPLFVATLQGDEAKIQDYSLYQEETMSETPEEPKEEASLENALASENINVTITVEVARLRMSLDKILELKPGNVINLPVSVDQPLDIRMNGKKIAKAELVKVGDMLGIKILGSETISAG